jgi:hypothetical protein
MPRLRPRRGIVLGIALALVVAVGTAGATGLVPDDVQQALGLAAAHSPDVALTPQIDQAVEQTSAPTVDGGTLELWTAPTTAGGSCAYLRRLDATGAPTDSGPISCAVSIAGGGRMGEAMGRAGSRPGGTTMSIGGLQSGGGRVQIQVDASGATMFGQAPGSVAKVEVVDSAGTVLGEAAANNGWFLLTLPADAASSATSIVEQSASGAPVGTLPISAVAPPATAGTPPA